MTKLAAQISQRLRISVPSKVEHLSNHNVVVSRVDQLVQLAIEPSHGLGQALALAQKLLPADGAEQRPGLIARLEGARCAWMLGRNEEAARYSGINTARLKRSAYVISAGLAGVTGRRSWMTVTLPV